MRQGNKKEENMLTKEQLLEKSKKPSADALKMHPFLQGQNHVHPEVRGAQLQ
jgi:hypothetical protein